MLEMPPNPAENEGATQEASLESFEERFGRFKEKEFLAQGSFIYGIEDESRRQKAEVLIETINAMEDMFWSIDKKHSSLLEEQ